MVGIYNEEKMKQKPVYPTRETAQYSDWALFNMGKELEKKVDEIGPGTGSLRGVNPINISTVEDETNISLKTGQGLTVDDNGYLGVDVNTMKGIIIENGKVKVNLETENSTIDYDLVTGKIFANINGMLHNGEDITFDSWGPQLPRAVKPNINGKITTGSGILNATTQSLCGASAIKEALSVKQNNLSAPLSGGLIINGQMSNLIGINIKNNGGIVVDQDGQVEIDDNVVQKKLTAGSKITIDQRTNTIDAKPQIETVRVKVIGTGASGQPPTHYINANTSDIYDITSYVTGAIPSGYKLAGQGTMFCTSMSNPAVIPCYFFYYNNKYQVQLFNTLDTPVTLNNMWVELLLTLE